MIEINSNGKIAVHWKVTPYDYSKEKVNEIMSSLSKKYGVSKDRIKVIADMVMIDDNGEELSIDKDIVQNIQDPNFQVKLFKEYLSLNKIDDYDFDLIQKIDTELNQDIDYQVYDKYRRYSIKWVRWSNFLSYGEGNFFNFSNLKGLVLLTGKPANQCGKTSFAIDLIHFLLFGKTDKVDVQSKIFNKHIPQATQVTVEGCITIDGTDYVINRTLSRPSLDKRTDKSKVVQRVEYYKIINGNDKESLEEYVEDQHGENTAQTNKIIKEAIGRESDFDLVMSITESNLDSLIDMKDTERGRMLSRWIGLLPLEEKDALARERYNSKIKPYLVSNRYDKVALTNENKAFEIEIENVKKQIKDLEKDVDDVTKEIDGIEEAKKAILQGYTKVDEEIMKVDISTLNFTIESTKKEGISKKEELESNKKRIEEIGDVEFSVEKYSNLNKELSEKREKKGSLGERYKSVKHNIEHLKTSEYCPLCKRKLDNVDNTKQIKEQEEELEKITNEGKDTSKQIEKIENEIGQMKKNHELYDEKSKLLMTNSALDAKLVTLRSKLKDCQNTLKEYKKNSEAIDRNNQIDISIRNQDIRLKERRNEKESKQREIMQKKNSLANYEKAIEERNKLIDDINKEEKLVRNWKIYLDMVGKNGISKMVFRRTLPIINARLLELLGDVCDFTVEVGISPKNDVMFYLIKDEVRSDLSSGSGYERTASSLALRSVLSDLSTIPRSNGILMDEIWGRVAKENYGNLMNLLNKISKSYDYMFLISHSDEIKDMCSTVVSVTKENNISKISQSET